MVSKIEKSNERQKLFVASVRILKKKQLENCYKVLLELSKKLSKCAIFLVFTHNHKIGWVATSLGYNFCNFFIRYEISIKFCIF